MKKKLIILVLAVISSVACAFGVTACQTKPSDNGGNGGTSCNHNYEYISFDKNEHSCICSKCGDSYNQSHSFNSNNVCSKCGEIKDTSSSSGSGDDNPSQNLKTVSLNPNGGKLNNSEEIQTQEFEVGKLMTGLPTPTRDGYTFVCWEEYPFGEEYTAASLMPNRTLQLRAKWEKNISGYDDQYVSFKPASEGYKDSSIRFEYYGDVDKFVYVELTSDDLGGVNKVGTENNFNLRTLEGMEYKVKPGYTWLWYQGSFNTPNGAQRFTLRYGSNIQFVTISDNSGVVQQTYLLDIYVKHDYYISLYSNIFESEPYDKVRVIENERFSAETKTKEEKGFEFDKRVYYNQQTLKYEDFVYSTAITKDWNLYQTYKPLTIEAELNEGTLADSLIITPYTQYFTLPSAEKEGYDFLGWQDENGKYLTNIMGYSGVNYISKENNPKKLTAIYSETKYYYTFENDTLKTFKTVPVVTYTDKTMTEILDVTYVPYNTDCVLPEKVAQGDHAIFTEWQHYYLSDNKEFSKTLSFFDFNTKITTPLALAPNMSVVNDNEYVVPLNGEITSRNIGTYRMYLPANERYYLTISATSSVTLTINQYGSTSNSKTVTVRSSTPQTYNLDFYIYNLGNTVYSHGYVTFKVTSLSGSFTAKLVGSTAETDGSPVITNDNNTAQVGEEFTVALAKPGYAFAGWYEGDKKVSDTEFISMEDREMTLTAKWVNCPVTLEKSIAEAGTVSGVSGTTVIGDEVTIVAETKAGYTWVGWYEGETKLTDELTYTFDMPSENTTYTAKWIKATIEKSISNAGTVSSLSSKYKVGDEVTVTASTNNGYTWVGWYEGENELTKELSLTFDMPAESVTYTAKWAKLTLARNNTSAGSVTTLNSKYTAGQEVTITATTNSSYTWLGWYNGEEELTKDASYTFSMPAENVTYTANWAAYTLTTATENTTYGTVTTKNAVRTRAGDEVTITATPKAGYTFVGWYSGDSLVSTDAVYKFNMPYESVTYTAKWTYYTLTTYVGNSIAGSITSYTAAKISVGEEVTIVATPNDGYTFIGWFSDEQLVDSSSTYTFNMPAETLVYTAKWIAYTISVQTSSGGNIDGYGATVSFYANDGSDKIRCSQLVTDQIGLKYPEIPLRDGYVFTGWYKDKECTALYDFTDQIKGNLNLYAGWYAMADSNYLSRDVIDIYTHNNSTKAYSIAVNGSSSSKYVYTYFTALTSGNYTIYYRNGTSTSSYSTYCMIYNVTQNKSIKSNATVSSTSYANVSFTANVGDIIYIRNYRYNTGNDTNFFMYVTGGCLPSDGGQSLCMVGDITTGINVSAGQEITINASTTDGYVFAGWYDGEILVSNNISFKLTMPAKNIQYYAKWIKNPITLTKNIDEAGSISGLEGEIAIGQTINLSATTNIGYTFIGWFKGTEKLTDNATYSFVLTEESATYTAQWTYYTLTTAINDNAAGSITTINGVKTTAGQEVTITATTNSGYTFLGWYNGENKLTNELSYTFNMPFENVIYTAKWGCYTLTTESNIENAGTYTIKESEKIEAKTDITLTATINDGYTWVGWYNGETQLTNELSYTFAMPFESVTYTAKWIVCPVVLSKSIDEAGTVSGVEGATKVGEQITITALTNDGYTWVGWYNGETELTNDLSYTFAMPSESITYTAKWIVCSVALNKSIDEAGTVSGVEGATKVGEQITITALTNKGYTFVGWYNGEIELTHELSYTFIMPADSVMYTAKWIVCPIVLNKNIEKAGTVSGVDKTRVGEQTTITATTYAGYKWLGWYNGNTLVTNEKSYTFEMSTVEITYTAKWEYYCELYVNEQLWETISSESVFTNLPVPTISNPNKTFYGWMDEEQIYYANAVGEVSTTYVWDRIDKLYATFYTTGYTPISTVDELKTLYKAGNYALVRDINFYGSAWSNLSSFSGVLDGNGYKICNYVITDTAYNAKLAFCYENNGTIMNLGFEGYTITGTSNAGAIAIYNNGQIINCYVNGKIEITSEQSSSSSTGYGRSAGGVCYENKGVIYNTYALGSVKTTFLAGSGGTSGACNVGGFVVNNYGSLINCFAANSVNCIISRNYGSGYYSGLVASYSQSSIINCYVSSSQTVSASTSGTSAKANRYNWGTSTTLANFKDIEWIKNNLWTADTEAWICDGNYPKLSHTYLDNIRNIQINTPEEFIKLNGQILMSNYELNCDVDLNEVNWVPLVNIGNFNGNGHSITNLTTDKPLTYAGLFGTNFGVVEKIGVTNIYINVSKSGNFGYGGGLVGQNFGKISNCYSKDGSVTFFNNGNGDYTYYASVGGLVGENEGEIENSFTNLDVNGQNYFSAVYAGGFVGRNYGTIDNSIALGNVTGLNTSTTQSGSILVGGFVASGAENINNCYCSTSQTFKIEKKTSSTIKTEPTNTAVEAKTPEELKSASFYSETLSWDISFWDFIDQQLPTLKAINN